MISLLGMVGGVLLRLAEAAHQKPAVPPPTVVLPTPTALSDALQRSDMVWSWNASEAASLPELWTEAPFIGNGMVGAYFTVDKLSTTLMIEVSRADYWDVRLPGTKYYTNRSYLDTPRLPGGFLSLTANEGSKISAGKARVHLFNASVTMSLELAAADGKVTTLTLSACALANRPSELLFEGSALDPSSSGLGLTYTPRPANGNRGVDPTPNPNATCSSPKGDGAEVVCKQDLIAGGGFAHARKLVCKQQEPNSCALLISLTNSVPAGVRANQTASALAVAALHAAETIGVPALKAAHCRWWAEDFWPRSFLSVPDSVVESFYVIQLYKVGSATRCDSPENCWAMDLAMPWYVPIGRWHDYHWDLNVQMSYWLVLPSNHGDLGKSLVSMMTRNLPYLIDSVPPEYRNDSAAQAANTGFEGRVSCDAFLVDQTDCSEIDVTKPVQLGNLAWVAHNLWWQYRYTLDPAALSTCISILKRAIGYYMRLMYRSPMDGKLHLPIAESPEYANANDTNYDLSLFRWGVGVLMHASESGLLRDSSMLGSSSGGDPDDFTRWSEVARQLTAFPADNKTGLLIGNGVELAHGHRHWSHLFSMFPTTLLNPGGATGKTKTTSAGSASNHDGPSRWHSPLAVQSLDHYTVVNGAGKFKPTIDNGFPRVAISVMSGMAGRPQAAYNNVSNWLFAKTAANDGYGGGSMGVNLGPNTMYQEAGGAPCNESPLGAAFAIQSWLLSSWSFGPPEVALKTDVIRVFPAVPPAWRSGTLSIGGMLAEGGYNVSGVYKLGKTEWVHLTATTLGTTRHLELFTDMAAPLVVTPPPSETTGVRAEFLRIDGERNVYRLTLDPSQSVLLQPAGSSVPTSPLHVSASTWPLLDGGGDGKNYWGKHKRAHFPPMPPPLPPPPLRPHPPPPPPVECSSGKKIPGYTCYESRCAGDSKPYPRANCGHDLCHPSASTGTPTLPLTRPTDALCALIPSGPNATAIAAARCNAYEGCTTFARSPAYTSSHCKAHKLKGVGDENGSNGECFKYFTSGKAGLSPAATWTAWVKDGPRESSAI